MKWSSGNRGNIEDRRGSAMRAGMPLGIGGMVLLLALSWFTGTDLTSIVTGGGGVTTEERSGGPVASSPEEERMVDFVDAVAGDNQAVWTQLLGARYQQSKVVLFRDAVQSACGTAGAATGPFYCPGDQQVYLDLSFFSELSERFGAPGDFAQAYVIAHEFGHHVQHLLGTDRRVQGRESGPTSASVALELQADCFAGVWGHAASQGGRFTQGGVELEPGDAEEALRAASAIGDDRLQKMSTGRIQPDAFTHGSSAQRMEWFNRGMESGDPARCDTFRGLSD